MGNSEVGHMHIGAGRVIDQDLTRISKSIANGDVASNAVLGPMLRRATADDKAIHLIGLLSPGGVHSHEDHTVELIRLAAGHGVKRVNIHAILDGRDTPPKSAAKSLQLIQRKCDEYGVGRIASIVGRYYAMDRNKHWDRTGIAYELIVDGRAGYEYDDPMLALDHAYDRGETDEFVKPTVICSERNLRARVEDGDFIVFTNFRADRARQLTAALTCPDFDCFERVRVAKLGAFLSMTGYGDNFKTQVIFPTIEPVNTFGELVAAHQLRQLRIAETEKYAHVTFFFNAGHEKPFSGEDRILIPSPEVATYDQKPEMSAIEVTDALVDAIIDRCYDVIICNYANADMVGHTGDFDATVKAIEILDCCLARIVVAARQVGMDLLITADHGNAEKMRSVGAGQETPQPHTAHTTNFVPLLYVGRDADIACAGSLIDIAPTMLALMDLEQPLEMSGRPLLKLRDSSQHAA